MEDSNSLQINHFTPLTDTRRQRAGSRVQISAPRLRKSPLVRGFSAMRLAALLCPRPDAGRAAALPLLKNDSFEGRHDRKDFRSRTSIVEQLTEAPAARVARRRVNVRSETPNIVTWWLWVVIGAGGFLV